MYMGQAIAQKQDIYLIGVDTKINIPTSVSSISLRNPF